MNTDEDKARRADQEFLRLDLRADGSSASVEVSDPHITHFGRLYGGAGTAFVSVVAEAVTGRRLLWMTTQFVGAARKGDRLDLRAEILAAGKRTTQVRVAGFVGDALVLHGIGACGEPGSDIPDVALPVPPSVPVPALCAEAEAPVSEKYGSGFFGIAERRWAGSGSYGTRRWWMRLPGHPPRPALLGLVSDFVPPMVMHAIGEPGAGTSLDNTIRVGVPSAGEWVLVDGLPEQAAAGYGHGSVRLWSEDGTLVGTASQSAALWRSLG